MEDSSNCQFSVVNFTDDSVIAVPSEWLFVKDEATYCSFPSKSTVKLVIVKNFTKVQFIDDYPFPSSKIRSFCVSNVLYELSNCMANLVKIIIFVLV